MQIGLGIIALAAVGLGIFLNRYSSQLKQTLDSPGSATLAHNVSIGCFVVAALLVILALVL